MADLNEVRLIGRLTRDPELRSTPSGAQVCSFGLATSKKYKGQDGVAREDTTFVDITCWSRLAEICGQYLRKGKQVFVGGRLRMESWQDKQTGQKRSKLSVVADNVQFLDPREQSQQGGQYQQPHQQSTYNAQPPAAVTSGWDDQPNLGEPPF